MPIVCLLRSGSPPPSPLPGPGSTQRRRRHALEGDSWRLDPRPTSGSRLRSSSFALRHRRSSYSDNLLATEVVIGGLTWRTSSSCARTFVSHRTRYGLALVEDLAGEGINENL